MNTLYTRSVSFELFIFEVDNLNVDVINHFVLIFLEPLAEFSCTNHST